MAQSLTLPEHWFEEPIKVLQIGAGGTGSHLFSTLMALDHSVRALHHPGGLHVTLCDGAKVTSANIGRQTFYGPDIGQNKAITLVQRANLFCGLDWVAVPHNVRSDPYKLADFDLIITCADKASVRAQIGRCSENGWYCRRPIFWLDTGNGANDGQVVLGHWRSNEDTWRIPNVYDLYPELETLPDEHAQRSCSHAEAVTRQALPINRLVADTAFELLWSWIRHGQLQHHGAYVRLNPIQVQPLLIDAQSWQMMGYDNAA